MAGGLGRRAAIGALAAVALAAAGCAAGDARGPAFPNLGEFPPKPVVSDDDAQARLREQLLRDRADGQALGAGAAR